MKLLFSSLVILLFVCLRTCVRSVAEVNNNAEALAECGNLHKMEFHNIPNAEALFSNENCMLKCAVGGKTWSNDSMNEGFACPKNLNGIYNNGQCISNAHPNSDALREGGNIHHIDFVHENSSGTVYSDSQCFLKCVIKGSAISTNTINEGFPCPENHNGICRHGRCVIETSVSTSVPQTTIVPTVSSHSPLSTHPISQIEIQITSANFTASYSLPQAVACIDDTLNQNISYCPGGHFGRQCISEVIQHPTKEAHWNVKCYMNGPFTSKDSLLTFVRYDHGREQVGHHLENVFALFGRHYRSFPFKTVPQSFLKEDLFPLFDEGQYTGDLKLSFLYKLTHES